MPLLIVEILGVFERNKGALLMLEAIRQRILQDFPDAEFAVPRSMPGAARERLGVLGVIRGGGLRARLVSCLPKGLLRARGLVRQSDVDVILDASGFGYGDFWGLAKLQDRLAGTVLKWRRPGKVAILLPQALGPFEGAGMRQAMAEAASGLDLIFVRDDISLKHLTSAGISGDKVVLAPDFTNLLEAPLPAELEPLRGASFVIPNEKMVAGERAGGREAYVRLLAYAAAAIAASGRAVHLLVHEGAADRALAEEVNGVLPSPLPVVDLPSPLDTKAVIATADLIVSSRFHGLVSALSSGVPVLACGWSHKYDALLADYGVREFSLAVPAEAEWAQQLQALLSAAGSADFRAKLKQAAEEQKRRTRAMWALAIDTAQRARAAKPVSTFA